METLNSTVNLFVPVTDFLSRKPQGQPAPDFPFPYTWASTRVGWRRKNLGTSRSACPVSPSEEESINNISAGYAGLPANWWDEKLHVTMRYLGRPPGLGLNRRSC